MENRTKTWSIRDRRRSSAGAYNTSLQAAEFYTFTRTMQAYRDMISGQTTMVLSTDSDLFKFLKEMDDATPKAVSDQPGPGAAVVRGESIHDQ